MRRPLRWGMIGCGSVAEIKSAPAYQLTEGFELAAVASRTERRAADYARRHAVEHVFADPAELIGSDQVDAVYIATPPDSHKRYALQTAAAGKPCCVEKPLAPDHIDCQVICDAFRERNLPLFVAYYRRSLPRFVRLKQMLNEGAIGGVRHIEWRLSRPPKPIDLEGGYNWRVDPRVSPGGYFDDLASHGLNLFAWLLGDFAGANGKSANRLGLYSPPDSVTATWSHLAGMTGTGSWDFAAEESNDSVRVAGSAGELSFSVFEQHPLVLTRDDQREEFFVENPVNIQLYHVKNMAGQLFDENPHPSSGLAAAHTAWVMDNMMCRNVD